MAEDFEGDPSRYSFNSEQWYYTRSLCRYMVETPMDDKGRVLFITKLLREPMSLLQSRVEQLSGQSNETSLRYLIHSAHDFQIAQFLVFLQPYLHDYTDIPFATALIFELHY